MRRIEKQLKQTLERQASLEEWALWLDCVVNTVLTMPFNKNTSDNLQNYGPTSAVSISAANKSVTSIASSINTNVGTVVVNNNKMDYSINGGKNENIEDSGNNVKKLNNNTELETFNKNAEQGIQNKTNIDLKEITSKSEASTLANKKTVPSPNGAFNNLGITNFNADKVNEDIFLEGFHNEENTNNNNNDVDFDGNINNLNNLINVTNNITEKKFNENNTKDGISNSSNNKEIQAYTKSAHRFLLNWSFYRLFNMVYNYKTIPCIKELCNNYFLS